MTSYEIAGQTVAIPVVVRDASAGTVMYEIDAVAARTLLPDELVPVESAPGRTQLALTIVDYRDNDLGDYLEVGVIFFVAPTSGGDPGTFIKHLPVDQAFTCEAGQQIWGFPKTVEQITLDYVEGAASCTLRMDGELVLKLVVPRAEEMDLPAMPMTSYTIKDGRLHATAFTQGGGGARVAPGGDGVHLELGTHPVAKELASLGLPDAPVLLTTWTQRMQGTFEDAVPL